MIDRRILWLILLVVVSIPTIWPVTIPNVISPESERLWKTIDSTPPNKIVLLSSTWTKSTRGESQGQAAALLHHMMSRRIRFALSSFEPAAAQVILDLVNEIAPRYNYVYGTDWVHLGFQTDDANFVKGINVNLITTVKKDMVKKEPLETMPLMQTVRSIDDVHIVVEIAASAAHVPWIMFLKQGVKLGFCPTSVMAPEALPYVSSGQLAGLLWGAKGAYDYEQLNVQNGTGQYAFGRKYMGPLSFAFGLVILSIAIGNFAMFLTRKQPAGGGA